MLVVIIIIIILFLRFCWEGLNITKHPVELVIKSPNQNQTSISTKKKQKQINNKRKSIKTFIFLDILEITHTHKITKHYYFYTLIFCGLNNNNKKISKILTDIISQV